MNRYFLRPFIPRFKSGADYLEFLWLSSTPNLHVIKGSSSDQPSGTLGQVTIDPPRVNKGPNEYYAGGAQSGVAVAAPPSQPVDNDKFVQDVFKVF